MDPIFNEEQEHLSATYRKLTDIEAATRKSLADRLAKAAADRADMREDLSLDFGNGVNLETYVEYEAMNKLVDEYNLAHDLDTKRLQKAQTLMRQPYFAKVCLQFRPGADPKELYIGSTGITDEDRHHFIIDWRSPVAETYYNQSDGKTSYRANGRTIECDLKLRRQFDITEDTLNAYFDTTVAIEDPLLLKSLAKGRNAKLTDITATIQKEQNQVVRHEDVPALLVNGIAGSGKTSVLLQRIAYLFYQERESLDPKDVYLITPNPVFSAYIDDVLPDMGESNPSSLTWSDLMDKLGLGDRGLGKDASADSLRTIDEKLATFQLEAADFQDIRVGREKVVPANQARAAYDRLGRFPAGILRANLTAEELHDKLEQRIERLTRSEDIHDEFMDLPYEEKVDIFGIVPQPASEQDFRDFARQYLEHRYAPVIEAIDNGEWLRIDRIGMRLLGKQHLSSAEYLYLKLALAGGGNRFARFVMVDEVQDYTEAQLMVLARYFNNAHFLLLGDENQAIKEGTATFEQIRTIFQESRGSVSECHLMTSYRSSPEITELFCSLMAPDERVKTSSVQRPGTDPAIMECATDDEYLTTLRSQVSEAVSTGQLTAIIAADATRMNWLKKQLADMDVTIMDGSAPLPQTGVLLLDISLAKGLEFDAVIIPDAQDSVYDESDLSRHRIYTAISRATQKVTLISQGTLTNLLKR